MIETSLKITAHLASPISGEPPNLDALLHFALAGMTAQGRFEASQIAAGLRPPDETSQIPLASRKCGDWAVYRCSSPILPIVEATTIERQAKAINTSNALLLAPKERKVLMPTKGWAKRYWCAKNVRAIDRVVWFAEGDKEALVDVLEAIPGVGMDVNCGYGRVERWEAEEACLPADSCWFADFGEEKVLMRPLPITTGNWSLPENLVGYRRGYGAVTFPYWHPDHQTAIVTPC